MNYIKELNAFYDWLEINELSPSAINLWYALMHINNKAAWAETFTVAESVLCVKTGLTDRTLRKVRNELKQKGRIDFTSRKGKAPIYRINSFFTPENNSEPKQRSENFSADSSEVSSGVRSEVSSALNKLNKTKQKEEEANPIGEYEKNFSPMTPIQMQKLMMWVDDFDNKEVVSMAVHETALINPRNPFIYLERVLSNWYKRKLFTVDDVMREKQKHEAEVLKFENRKRKPKQPVDWDKLERMIANDE